MSYTKEDHRDMLDKLVASMRNEFELTGDAGLGVLYTHDDKTTPWHGVFIGRENLAALGMHVIAATALEAIFKSDAKAVAFVGVISCVPVKGENRNDTARKAGALVKEDGGDAGGLSEHPDVEVKLIIDYHAPNARFLALGAISGVESRDPKLGEFEIVDCGINVFPREDMGEAPNFFLMAQRLKANNQRTN